MQNDQLNDDQLKIAHSQNIKAMKRKTEVPDYFEDHGNDFWKDSEGVIMPGNNWTRTNKAIPPEERIGTWKRHLLGYIDQHWGTNSASPGQGLIFFTRDLYIFENSIKEAFPENENIRNAIAHTLKNLAKDGYLKLVGKRIVVDKPHRPQRQGQGTAKTARPKKMRLETKHTTTSRSSDNNGSKPTPEETAKFVNQYLERLKNPVDEPEKKEKKNVESDAEIFAKNYLEQLEKIVPVIKKKIVPVIKKKSEWTTDQIEWNKKVQAIIKANPKNK